MPTAADEGRHQPGPAPGWEESWQLDFSSEDGSFGGSLRLGLRPEEGVSWVWCFVVGEGRRLVTVVEQEAPLPRAGALDLRCDGLWTDVVCETPLEHWSVGLEAFGVALDEPGDALRGLRGDRIGVGLDLGWEAAGPAWAAPPGSGYAVPADVHGEVLLGTEAVTFDGWGVWAHDWGPEDWWGPAWRSAHGRFDDGTRWHAPRAGTVPVSGPRPGRSQAEVAVQAGAQGPGAPPVLVAGRSEAALAVDADAEGPEAPPGAGSQAGGAVVVAETAGGHHGMPVEVVAMVDGLEVTLTVAHVSPVPLERPPDRSQVVRALCPTTTSDGRAGTAWYTFKQAGPHTPT